MNIWNRRNLVSALAGSMVIISVPGIVHPETTPASAFVIQELHKGDKGRRVAYARVDVPADYRLKIRVPKPFVLASLSKNVSCRGFAMTGGYMSKLRPVPDGLIVVGGKVRGKDNRRLDGGFVQIQGPSVSLRRATLPRSVVTTDVDQIYSQPILVYGGAIDSRFKGGRANRVALGKYQDGSLFFVMAYNGDRNGLSAVTLTEFAKDVLAISHKKVDWLMNFDGGPSAFLTSPDRTIAYTNGSVSSYLCAEASID